MALLFCYLKVNDAAVTVKVKVSPIYDLYAGKVPVREDICPGQSAL